MVVGLTLMQNVTVSYTMPEQCVCVCVCVEKNNNHDKPTRCVIKPGVAGEKKGTTV